ncbi:MAG: nucleoside triphosphate pyrophosphohydrolase [Armatimonadetes bacterium]|nr:nucleoside triphosphate pyrophosphohydrolase [Armatimonadota bacterium]
MIRVVGLGPGDPGLLGAKNLQALQSGKRLILRTGAHPVAKWLRAKDIRFETCDDLIESAGRLGPLHASIVDRVLAAGENAVYAVPGNPLLGEESVRLLMQRVEVEVLAAPSLAEAAIAAAGRPVSGPLHVWSARDLDEHRPDPRAAQVVLHLDSRGVAENAKSRLLKFFPPDHPVYIVFQGMDGARVERAPLSEMDRAEFRTPATACLEPLPLERPAGFYGLVHVVDRLLGPGGCPWDREQTHHSLKQHMLEETYEALEAIDSGDPDRLCEELGDFLLQALMHAQMDAAEGLYDVDDVITTITSKLVRRHPHVFGDKPAADADEVLRNWDTIKQAERGKESRSILDGVPKSMPALLRAFEVSNRAARTGFDWPSLEAVFEKVEEERRELDEAVKSGVAARVEEEIGDLFFALANVARRLGVEPEDALRGTVNRFVWRFQDMERRASRPLRELSAEEWEALWVQAKAQSRQ